MTDMSSVRRGFVEGLFVLVSILMAFWADAWWDQRQAVSQFRARALAIS